jgi:hypothetical protein
MGTPHYSVAVQVVRRASQLHQSSQTFLAARCKQVAPLSRRLSWGESLPPARARCSRASRQAFLSEVEGMPALV